MTLSLGFVMFGNASGDMAAIRVEEAAVCRGVVNRAPVGAGDVMSKDVEKIYCFTKITGATGETEVTHNWYYKGSLKSSVVLPVKSGSWRTWSSKSIVPEWTGEWMVEILSRDGKPLDTIIFFVQ